MSDRICHCCAGVSAQTPAPIENRPGLGAVTYRSGTWAQFKATMLSGLSLHRELDGLQTRADDDFAIALLDAWAVACDILTFYQERIATESYLRTATELLSVGELAKLLGYKLRPGLAASVPLAFDVRAPLPGPATPAAPPTGLPPSLVLGVGMKVQSVPDPGQPPATFETVDAIVARGEWTAIAPRMTAPAAASTTSDIAVAATDAQGAPLPPPAVKVGDYIVLAAGGARDLQRVIEIVPPRPPGTTHGPPATVIRFGNGGAQPGATAVSAAPTPLSPQLDDEFVQAYVKGRLWSDQSTLVALAAAQSWALDDLEARINAAPAPERNVRAYVMGVDAALFGHNATAWNTLAKATRDNLDNWEDITLENAWPLLPGLVLDQVYRAILPGAPVVLLAAEEPPAKAPTDGAPAAKGSGPKSVVKTKVSTHFSGAAASANFLLRATEHSTVTGVDELTRSDYLLSAKVTKVTLDTTQLPSVPAMFGLRGTQVLVSTEELAVGEAPLDGPVGRGAPSPLELDRAYLSLVVGQRVAVTGVRADKAGATETEVVAIKSLSLRDGFTRLEFTPELSGAYIRSTVTINANVAESTHGETRSEILGSGDATQPFQRFALRQPPLTYTSAATPSGTASTLLVRVDGVRWTEVDWLYGSGSTDRVYMVIIGADGTTYVQFGDGTTGARPGSGTNNILATYRQGIGRGGLVRAGQASQLLSRPPGLNGVRNPLPSTGAADPETLDQARPNAPLSVKTLDRIVTLADFGDFAAASAAIGKAAASWVWDGSRFIACVTVAGTDGAPVVPGSDQATHLLQSINAAGDRTVPVALCAHVPRTFTVGAIVTPDPLLVPEAVVEAVRTALRDAFGFNARGFAQPVARSEVIAVIQGVRGVVASTLTALHLTGASGVADTLDAAPPTLGPSGLAGAELLILESGLLPGMVVS